MNENSLKLIALLNSGEYCRGSELAKALTISRTAIWKQIKSLQQIGYPIVSDPQQGYQLQIQGGGLLPQRFWQHYAKLPISQTQEKPELFVLSRINSTNDFLKSQPLTSLIQLCVAEQQTQGRGRFGRHWHSPFGQNLYLSLRLNIKLALNQLSGISLCIGLAVLNALQNMGDHDEHFALKWPNDLLLSGKKVAGILIELSGEANSDAELIIGIGINVNMVDAALDNQWTSLAKHFNRFIDRNQLAANVFNSVIQYLKRFEQAGLTAFLSEWQHYDYLEGKAITLHAAHQDWHGQYAGIDPQGNVCLNINNTLQVFGSGDVSLSNW